MEYSAEIEHKEIILRRIPPEGQVSSTQPRSEGGLRAASVRLQNRKGENCVSWSRLLITSPGQLLEQLALDDISPEGWMVCRIAVSEIRKIGWEVVYSRTEQDPGHCHVIETERHPFTRKLWKKVSLKTRILTPDEVTSVQAGDDLAD